MKKLDIILRTCQNSVLDEKAKHGLTRVCGSDRSEMLFKCFTSLIVAINNTNFPIKLTVLDDHSSVDFLARLRLIASKCRAPYEIISLHGSGPNNSAYEQFHTAADCEDLVYSVEDDYLHEATSLISMLNAYKHFTEVQHLPVMIFPFDCPLRYEQGKEELTRLYYDGTRYWRQVTKTTNTFLTKASTMAENFSAFRLLAEKYPQVLEDDTINKLYYNEEMKSGAISVYNPIPSIAYHLSYTPHMSIRTGQLAWEHLWSSTRPWDLINGWFNFEDFYTNVVPTLKTGATVVEVGAWMGKSTACLATLCKAQNKDIKVHVVDTWQGSDEEVHRELMKQLEDKGTTLYDVFKDNMQMAGLEPKDLVIHQGTSIEVSRTFPDDSVDFVMLDASHDFENVCQDIVAWVPKIKSGGIIAGDDYSDSWPGVKAAVDNLFTNTAVQIVGTTWFARKE